MQENIKKLLKDCFAHLGKLALYESKDKSYMVQVLKQQPDKLYGIGDGKFVGKMLFLEVSIFDILKPMVGDIFVIDGCKYKVYSPPLRDIALFTIIRTDRNMLLACYSHKHISYRIRTIIRKAITQE